MVEYFDRQMLVNAIDEDGRRVHIADVVKGDGRVYRCPSSVCGHQVLIPRKGEIRRHHFAHKSGKSCEWAIDAGIADLVSEILQTERRMLFPALDYLDTDREVLVDLSPARMLRIENVERADLSGRPVSDIVVTCRAGEEVRKFAVVAWLAHSPAYSQVEDLEAAGYDCVSLDLGELYREMKEAAGKHLDGEAACAELQSEETLRHALLNESPCKRWLCNRKASELQKKSLAARAERKKRESLERKAREERVARERLERAAARAAEEEARLARAAEDAEKRRLAKEEEERERRLKELVVPAVSDMSNAEPRPPLRKRELGAFPNCWVWKCPTCGTDDQVTWKGAAEAVCRRCSQAVVFG